MTFDPTKPVQFRGPTKCRNPKIVVITDARIAATYIDADGKFTCGTWHLGGNWIDELHRYDLINIPEKKVAREFWINRYPEDMSCVHSSVDSANKDAAPALIECVHVREVLEDDMK